MSIAMALPSSPLIANYLEFSYLQVNPEIRFLTHDMTFGLSLLRASSKLHLSAKWVWWNRGHKECADIFIIDYQHHPEGYISEVEFSEECFNCLVLNNTWKLDIKPQHCHCILSKSLGASTILEKVLSSYNMRRFQ